MKLFVKRWWRHGVGVLLLLVLVTRFDIVHLFRVVEGIRFDALLVGTLLVIPNIGIRAFRFQIILNRKLENRISFLQAAEITLVGLAMNLILPAGMGDITKVVHAHGYFPKKERLLSAATLDKFVAVLTLVGLGTAASFVLGISPLAFPGAAIFGLLLLFYFVPRLVPWKILSRAATLVSGKNFDPKGLSACWEFPLAFRIAMIVLSAGGWLVTWTAFFFLLAAVGASVGFFQVCLLAPPVHLVQLVPVTVDGVGTQEATLVYLFSQAGVASAPLVVFALLYRVLMRLIPAVLGAVLLMRGARPLSVPPTEAESHDEPR